MYIIHMLTAAAPTIEHLAVYHRSAVSGGPSSGHKLERCQDYCLSKWAGVGIVFDDTGLSGLSFDRPALKSLMEKAQAGAVKVLVIHDFSALGREPFLTFRVADYLIRLGVEIHTVASDGPIKSAQFAAMEFDTSNYQSAQLARMKAGRERAKRTRE